MRKLYALAAISLFALTLTLGTIGCAPKQEEATPPAEPTPTETPAPPDSAGFDTTSHM